MLNIEIVKLVEDYDGWTFPKIDSLGSGPIKGIPTAVFL